MYKYSLKNVETGTVYGDVSDPKMLLKDISHKCFKELLSFVDKGTEGALEISLSVVLSNGKRHLIAKKKINPVYLSFKNEGFFELSEFRDHNGRVLKHGTTVRLIDNMDFGSFSIPKGTTFELNEPRFEFLCEQEAYVFFKSTDSMNNIAFKVNIFEAV